MKKVSAILLASLLAGNAQAHEHDGATMAQSSDFSLSYDYMYMHMNDNLDGTHHVSDSEIYARGFMMAPSKMDTQVHSLTGSYNINSRNKISLTVPYVIKDMDMNMMGGGTMKMRSRGIGDTAVKASYAVTPQIKAYYGINLATGSVKKSDDGMRLGYTMQTGSGTYDPIVGAGYSANSGKWNYGADAGAVLRFGHNSEDYRFGNEYNVSAFAKRQISAPVAIHARVEGKSWGNVKGQDSKLDPMMDETQVANLQGGKSVNTYIGLDFSDPNGRLEGTTLSAEIGVPVYQHLDGPQLSQDYSFMVTLKKEF